MAWSIEFTSKSRKQFKKLPEMTKEVFMLLLTEIEGTGPVRSNWKNYSKLSKDNHHCHIKSGRPTYVVCWRTLDKKNKLIEVYYVGTHEKAPY